MFGMTIDEAKKSKLILGNLKNSQNNSCALLGMERNWSKLSDNFDFIGMYAYAGEIPGIAYENCGDKGIYKILKRYTGVGFAPYIWHGVRYNATKHMNIGGGFVFPCVLTATIEWKF